MFIALLLTIAKIWKRPISINGWMDTKDVVLIYIVFFSRTVMFDSLWPHGLQHARPPCPSPSPKACSSSGPLHRWCHPASRTFPMSKLFASDDQNTGVSALASVLPTIIQGWFPLRLTGFISLPSNTMKHYSSMRKKGFLL